VKVAVIPVEVVQGPVDEVVDVVAVRNLGVPAARMVLRGALDGRAGGGPATVHLENVFRDAGAAR
jgi:hypothetical protein